MTGKKKPWCVKHLDGWCAIKSGMRPAGNATNVPTKCGHFVVLPIGFMQTTPGDLGADYRSAGMTGKKRGKKMTPVKAWALLRNGKFYSATHRKSGVAAAQRIFSNGSKHNWQLARVLISEIPSGRGK